MYQFTRFVFLIISFWIATLHLGSAQAIQASLKQKVVSAKIAQILQSSHYARFSIDDSLSNRMFNRYLDALDYNRIYFLKSDIDNFELYRFSFDEDIQVGNLTGAYEMYSVFKQRFEEQLAAIPQRLKDNFDFQKEDSFTVDMHSLPFAKDKVELNERWYKWLKNQALELKLSGKADTSIVSTIKNRFDVQKRNMDKFNSDDVYSLYLNAFCAAIDPHTNYLAPANAENFKIDMNLSLEGIGARLQTDNDYTKVFEVVVGGPAFKSKLLKKDDKILAVAQGDTGAFVDVIGWRIDDVVKLIRGPKGSVVRLSILQSETPNAPPKTIRLVREKVNLEEQAAKKKLITTKHNGKSFKVGVISIPNFYMNFEEYQRGNPNYRSTTRDVKKLIVELQSEKIDGLIIDLRNNGGGALPEAISLTGLFIPSGPAVQVKQADGSVDVEEDKDGGEVSYNGPLAVMVNRFSASASEIFAGAIQDYQRGVIIGERTFGKGTVQNLTNLNRYIRLSENLGDLKLTVAKFYRITGSSTQLKGVSPDLQMPSFYLEGEVGEESEANSLPWDEIPPSNFKPYGGINKKLISDLQKKHETRAKNDEEFREYIKDIEDLKKRRSVKVVSLQESKRKAERDELEKKRLAKQKKPDIQPKGELNPDDENDLPNSTSDPVLNESAKILADLITLS